MPVYLRCIWSLTFLIFGLALLHWRRITKSAMPLGRYDPNGLNPVIRFLKALHTKKVAQIRATFFDYLSESGLQTHLIATFCSIIFSGRFFANRCFLN